MPTRIRDVWPDMTQAIGRELVDTLDATRQAGPAVLTLAAALGVVLGTVWTPITIAMVVIFLVVVVVDLLLDGLIAARDWVDAYLAGNPKPPQYVFAALAGSFVAKAILAFVVPIVMAIDGMIVLGIPAGEGVLAEVIRLGLLTKGAIASLTLVIAISSLQKIDRETGGKVPPIAALLRLFARLRDSSTPGSTTDRAAMPPE